MPDDKQKVGGADRGRISLTEVYEVRDWTSALGVSEQQLRQAIAAVGNSTDAVRVYLDRR